MRFFYFLPVSLIMTFLSMILAPVLPFFSDTKGWLPKWLWWFQTPDNPIDGDPPFKELHAPFKGEWVKPWQRHVNQMFWLWRNPSYGFDWTVVAFQADTDPVILKGNRPLGGELHHDGWFYAVSTNTKGETAWQLYITHHWTKKHTTKINIGWKLWSAPGPCQLVFSPQGVWKKI